MFVAMGVTCPSPSFDTKAMFTQKQNKSSPWLLVWVWLRDRQEFTHANPVALIWLQIETKLIRLDEEDGAQ